MGTLFYSSHSPSRARAIRLTGALLVVAAIAATVGAPLVSAQPTVINADKAVFGGTTFGDVLRVVGAGQVDSGVGTMNPWVLDSEGDARRDTVTTVSPASVWNFGSDHVTLGNGFENAWLTLNGASWGSRGLRFQEAGVPIGQFFVTSAVTSLAVPHAPFRISTYPSTGDRLVLSPAGDLQTGGYIQSGPYSALPLAGQSLSNVRMGNSTGGASSIIFDIGGAANQWTIENNPSSVLRIARLNAAGATDHVAMSLDGNIRLAPYGKRMFPDAPYGVDLGSLQNPFGSLYVGTIEANTINTIENTATVDNRWLVGDGNILDADLSPSATTMIVRYNNYASGEFVYLQKFAKTEFVKTTSGPTLTNLLNGNASFENGTVTNWTASAPDTIANSTTKSYHGERAMLLTTNADGILHVSYTGFAVATSTQYTACAFFRRSDAVIPAVGTVQVSGRNSGYANMTIEPQGTDGWFRACATFTSGTGPDTALYFVMSTANTVNYHIDGVQLETGNVVRPYSEYRSSYTIDRHAEDVPTGIGHQWYTGDGMFSTGATSGYGWLDCYALTGMKSASEQGPACVANVRTGTSFNQWEPHAAWGNLNGIYGYGATIFGFAAGAASSGHVTADPTNGVRLRYGSTNRMVLGATSLTFNDAAGTNRMLLDNSTLTFKDPAGASRMLLDNSSLTFRDSIGTNRVVLGTTLAFNDAAGITRMLLDSTALTFRDPANIARMSLTSNELTFNDPAGTRQLAMGTSLGTPYIELGRPVAGMPVLNITPSEAKFCAYGGACTVRIFAAGNIEMSGSLTLSGSVNATGSITTQNTLTANGAITTNSTLTANGAITTNSSITAKGDITTYKNIYLIADPGNTMFGNIESQNEWSLKRGTGLRIRRNLSGGPGINFAHALAIGESPNYNDLQIYTVGAGIANIYKPSGDLIIGDQSQGIFGNVPSKVVLVSDGNGAAGDRGNSLEVGPDGIIFHFYKSPPATTAQVDRVRPNSDGLMYLGSPSQRWANIHLSLGFTNTQPFVIVGNPNDSSSFAAAVGISGWRAASGSCSMRFQAGLLMETSGC